MTADPTSTGLKRIVDWLPMPVLICLVCGGLLVQSGLKDLKADNARMVAVASRPEADSVLWHLLGEQAVLTAPFPASRYTAMQDPRTAGVADSIRMARGAVNAASRA